MEALLAKQMRSSYKSNVDIDKEKQNKTALGKLVS